MTTILLVEDDEILLENISLELEMHGYDVLEAQDGQHAMEILANRRPDIIVSDISMPKVDGFELLTRIRGDRSLEAIPMLFLSALSSLDSVRHGKKLGIDDYIVKPFQVEDLIIAIENKLRRSASFRMEATQEMTGLRRQLLQVLAHEMRTPLVPIQGGAEMLADYVSEMPDDYIQNLLDLIQSGVGRMNRLTNRSLALLRLDSGEFQETYAKLGELQSLMDIVGAAQMSVEQSHDIFDKDAELILTSSSDPLFVYGIYEYLQMMIEEPLRNAVEAAPAGTSVLVDIQQDGDQVIITISDQGPGISEEQLRHALDCIDRVKEDYIVQGAGMGLAIMRQTAQAHGGTCVVESIPGTGTTVTLSLPLADLDDAL